MGYWARRKPADVLNRRRKLKIYDTRMEFISERSVKVKTNVIPFKRRKKASKRKAA
jgi:hypothetical protein